jgi:lysophospholipase L1-like esterase
LKKSDLVTKEGSGMSSRTWWRFFAVFSLLSTLLLVAGFYIGVRDILYPSATAWKTDKREGEKKEVHKEKAVQIVALGDSLTRGTGDQAGLGYVGNLRIKLAQASGREVYVLNHGVNGYKTADVLRDLQQKEDIRRTIRQADIVTFSIGGNDLFNVQSDEVQPDVSRKRMPGALARYERIVSEITALNPKAKVLYMGLYNAFADLSNAQDSYAVVEQWNQETMKMLYKHPNTIFVPTDDLFRIGGVKYLSSDHFHPNQAGYQRIGARMAEVIE